MVVLPKSWGVGSMVKDLPGICKALGTVFYKAKDKILTL